MRPPHPLRRALGAPANVAADFVGGSSTTKDTGRRSHRPTTAGAERSASRVLRVRPKSRGARGKPSPARLSFLKFAELLAHYRLVEQIGEIAPLPVFPVPLVICVTRQKRHRYSAFAKNHLFISGVDLTP